MSKFRKIKGKLLTVYSAAKAGWIASNCKTGCVIDDEEEEIRACWLHMPEITRLAKMNEEAQ